MLITAKQVEKKDKNSKVNSSFGRLLFYYLFNHETEEGYFVFNHGEKA